MVNYVGLGDLYRIYLEAQRAGANFNVAYIGDDFQAEHKVQFDQEYMRALYRFGYEKAAKGYPWGHAHQGFEWQTGEHFHANALRRKILAPIRRTRRAENLRGETR